MGFKFSDLSVDQRGLEVELKIDGVSSMRARSAVPIPRTTKQFKTFVLERPMFIGEVSDAIYDDISAWALIAEWNGLPEPTKWLRGKRLPVGYRVFYLPFAIYKAMARGAISPHLAGLSGGEE